MNKQRLIHDLQIAAGEHVRIWQERDGRFLFEHLMPTGRWVTIACNTLDEAMSLWKQVEKDHMPIQRSENGTDTSQGGAR